MKRYIFTLALGVVLSFTQCTMNDIDVNVTPSANSGLHIIGAAADFDNHNVGTRAAEDAYPDSFISEMTMFVFDINGDLLQGLDANQNPISSAINIPQSNPTFLIEAKKYNGTGIISSMGASLNIKYFRNTGTDLSACSIYIVANAYHQISHLIDSDDSNGEIKTLADLKAAVLDIDATLSMPKDENGDHIGFPMIGHAVTPDDQVATFDLRYGTNTETNAVANIPLIKLYSKVYFAIQINSNQIVANGPTPKFTIDRAEVFNVPTKACMGAYSNDYINKLGNEYQFTSDPFVIKSSDCTNKTIYHTTSSDISIGLGSSDLIEFYFYMPEHKVTPNDINPYPANIPSNLKQYYKPKLVGAGSDGSGLAVGAKTATFVRIYGSYTDHNGRIKGVSYDVYLGQNETNDFEVKRNQQLINYLTITGTTNHKDAYGENQTNISVDHRVTMTDRGYNVYMEREAILDAHFEVRPIDIELQWGSSIQIVIPSGAQNWIALEGDDKARSGVNSGLYIDNDNERRGVRKYFTTNLVSELNTANKGTILLQHSSCKGGTSKDTEYYRVWFYFDENPNVYDQNLAKDTSNTVGTGNNAYTVSDKLYRMAPVNFYYSGNATDTPNTLGTPVQVVNFQQWNLWRVWDKAGTQYYDIEHEEEYLNNYASNAGYGPKQNGMAWGLDGLQLSDTVKAFAQKSGDSGSRFWNLIMRIIDYLINNGMKNRPTYDFYNTQKEAQDCGLEGTEDEYFPYNGYNFCKKIITKANASSNADHHIKELWLSQSPKSAVEYCYNKNKRNANGIVEDADLKWYLPAIDEIQDIASQCYGEFDGVFQKNFYWSSQPAYQLAEWNATVYYILNGSGYLYHDNVNYARATRAIVDNTGNFTYEPSGMTATNEHWEIYDDEGKEPKITYNNKTVVRDLGYKSRTAVADHCRIRAVYRSGKIE